MTYLRNAVLATLAYYDIFDMPLTLLEIYKHLINPARLMRGPAAIPEISLAQIQTAVDKLLELSTIGQNHGYYFLNGRGDLVGQRLERIKIADQKWKKFMRIVKWLALVPYLRAVFASGSLALSNTDKESDFDVLIVMKSGRLYTGRLALTLLTSLMGVRRGKNDKRAPDKLCFNHFIVDGKLGLTHESVYTAATYSCLVPVIAPPDIFYSFYSKNTWINKFIYHCQPVDEFPRRSIEASQICKIFANICEKIFDSWLGNGVENLCRWHQQRRIKKTPATYAVGGRVAFNDCELEFHPYSFEKTVIEKYNYAVENLGLMPAGPEKDSGLTYIIN